MDEHSSNDRPLFGADAANLGRQIVRESIEHDIAEVIGLLRDAWSDAAIAEWLVKANSDLDGESHLDLLRANDLPAVIEVAALARSNGTRNKNVP